MNEAVTDKLVWTKKDIRNILLVVLGAFLTSVGLKLFVESKGLMPSGLTGLASLFVRVLSEYFNIYIPFSIVYLIFSAVPALIVYKHIGRKFTILSLLHVLLVSVFTSLIPAVTITDDTLLVCIFGGIFAAAGSLSSLRANASSGGTDFLAIYLSTKYNRSAWNQIMVFNGIMLAVSGILFDIEPALYSIIYQFTNTTVVNTFHDRYQLRGLTIITKQPDLISDTIFSITRRGITEVDGVGKYSNEKQSILYLVAGAHEVDLIIRNVRKKDPLVFISDAKIDRVYGNFYQKPFE